MVSALRASDGDRVRAVQLWGHEDVRGGGEGDCQRPWWRGVLRGGSLGARDPPDRWRKETSTTGRGLRALKGREEGAQGGQLTFSSLSSPSFSLRW